ncbi:MAG: right-handed parallel beta-helix repeat-containing protein, partial [Planctomycetota bacterium]
AGPPPDDAVKTAVAAAEEAARPLIDTGFHGGAVITVPDDHGTIQAAIDAAAAGDSVLVRAGTYHELIVMKDGVKLVSDSSGDGDELVAVRGARLRLPRRALRTIIDGSRAKPSEHGMIDFLGGVGRRTIVDGFTIQELPAQNHHEPGHAHGLNVRGASPVIMNCHIRANGSTGIGNHVVYNDQKSPIGKRDFRWENIKHQASAVIYRNIIRDNLGLGVGCNHFSTPFILGNEIFNNDDAALGEQPSPGVGAQHGAAPTIVGNIVHDNPGGGLLCKLGSSQGAHPIDRPTHAVVTRNVVYKNGSARPAIASQGGGSREMPIRFIQNFVYSSKVVGVALSDQAVGVIEANVVSDCDWAGIAVNGSTVLKLNRNQVTRTKAPGFVIAMGAVVHEMIGNAADSTQGPRFLLRDSTVHGE